MITQAMKDWFHKMFAWWPWKQSTPLEYQHVASAVTSGTVPETSLWTSKEGTVSQTGATPRRFTLESRTERLVQPPPPEIVDAPPPGSLVLSMEAAQEAEANATSPTPQQRLEFLRYLVQRGIVNEGFEEE